MASLETRQSRRN